MSTERWDDEMLDRLATKIDSLASTAEIHSRVIEVNSQLIQSNARVIQALANVAAESREERQQLFQSIAQQQTEIRGMQAENRRILDILLNDRDRGDRPSN